MAQTLRDGRLVDTVDDILGSQICRIYTGTYTGDGALSQAITGVGFTVKYVRIWLHQAAGVSSPVFEKSDIHAATVAHKDLDGDTDVVDNAIIALGADGFTVDDAGADSHPNKNLQAYDFLCLGDMT